MEVENDGMLPFLGIQLLNRVPHIETEVLVKPTSSGLLLRYHSHVDNRYKRSLFFPGSKEKISTPQSTKTAYGQTVIDQPTIVQRFNEYFTGVVSRLLETAGLSLRVGQFSSRKFTSECFILQPTSEKFILKQLRDLKVRKAAGLDRIPARFLKDSAAVIAPTIAY